MITMIFKVLCKMTEITTFPVKPTIKMLKITLNGQEIYITFEIHLRDPGAEIHVDHYFLPLLFLEWT